LNKNVACLKKRRELAIRQTPCRKNPALESDSRLQDRAEVFASPSDEQGTPTTVTLQEILDDSLRKGGDERAVRAEMANNLGLSRER
jgi:hypothetical protein